MSDTRVYNKKASRLSPKLLIGIVLVVVVVGAIVWLVSSGTLTHI